MPVFTEQHHVQIPCSIQQGAVRLQNTSLYHCVRVRVMTQMYITKGEPSVCLCSENSIMCKYLTDLSRAPCAFVTPYGVTVHT